MDRVTILEALVLPSSVQPSCTLPEPSASNLRCHAHTIRSAPRLHTPCVANARRSPCCLDS